MRSPLAQGHSTPFRSKGRITPGERKYELLNHAAQQYRAGSWQDAARSLQQLRQLDPYLSQAHELEARIALDAGDPSQYVESLRALALTNPTSAQLQDVAGRCLVQLRGNPQTPDAWQAGLKSLERAVELEPHNSTYTRDLAAAHLLNGDADSALRVLTDALARNPADPFLPPAIARLHASLGDWDSAIPYFDLSLQKDPHDLNLRRARARCLYYQGDYSRAREDYQHCFSESSERLSLPEYVEFGDACLRVGDYAQGQAAFDAIARTGAPRIKEVELLRSLCALRQGHLVQAKGILTTALTYWPHDSSIHAVLVICGLPADKGVPAIQMAVHEEEQDIATASHPSAESSDAARSAETPASPSQTSQEH